MSVMGNFVSVLVGAAVTWFAAWWYYRRAGEELREEARDLQRLTTLVLHALHNAGIADVNWTEDGRVRGINIKLTLNGPPPTMSFVVPPATLSATTPGRGPGS